MGFLVECLRERQVDAWGIDISVYAIQHVTPKVQPFCRIGSIIDPFPLPRYDLIVCIEVLEHLLPDQALQAVANLTRHSDDILLSSTPLDLREPTHFNVQPPDYWAKLFYQCGFARDVDYDASFISPWAMRFRRTRKPVLHLITAYERRLWTLQQENQARREFNLDQRQELILKEEEIQKIVPRVSQAEQLLQHIQGVIHDMIEKGEIKEGDTRFLLEYTQKTEADNRRLSADLDAKDKEVQTLVDQLQERDRINQSLANQLHQSEQVNQNLSGSLRERNQAIQDYLQQISSLFQVANEKDRIIQEILTSRSWRFMQKFQHLRLRLIPLGSHRERLMHSAFAGAALFFREGPVAFLRRLNEKTARRLKMLALRRRHIHVLNAQAFPVEASHIDTAASTPPPPHHVNADIIVCVHNALQDTQSCLESIIRYTLPPYTLILIDDGSDPPTQEYLAEFARHQGAILLRNDQARGYTYAANQGLRQATNPYAVLLNSDTIVTHHWIDRMVACGESDSRIGIIGPLSNTASWQSIPDIFHTSGDWADNPLPEGLTLPEMAERVAYYSARLYPQLPFLNGFCLMIKRALIDEIGFLDEENFGQGYGEENDYCLRAAKAGWLLAVADDTYIYHAQSRSYSHERRKALVERSDKALAAKHGQAVISAGVQICRSDRVMLGNRARSQVMALRQETIEAGKKRWEGKRLLFILPISQAGGGGHVIIQEAEAMLKMGADVRFLNLRGHQYFFENAYPGLQIPTLYVDSPRQTSGLLGNYDAVIGTVYHSLNWMELPASSGRGPVRGYYIQDFEPHFFNKGSLDHQQAWDSYTRFPDLVLITKTEWNRRIIQEQIGVDCQVVGASMDLELFRPRQRKDPNWPDRPLRITAMVRPSTPRRQPGFTLQVLQQILRRYGGNIEVILFGCQPEDPDFHQLIEMGRSLSSVPWRHAGILTRSQLASLLNEVDIFADFSSFQALGLTAMEAMACGSAVVVPQEGGAETFARHKENAILTDTSSLTASINALEQLIQDEAFRNKLQQQAIFDVCQFYPEKAAFNILEALFS